MSSIQHFRPERGGPVACRREEGETKATAMPPAVVDVVPSIGMTEEEARSLTNRIKGTTEQLWSLLLEAHDRQAWQALGYISWREYAKNEFGMGQSYAYRLLDQGRVIRTLEGAAGVSPVGEISERVARDIKPQLPVVTNEVQARIAPAARNQ